MERSEKCPWRVLFSGVGPDLYAKRARWLGIINLRRMNLALRARWLWLSRVEASRPGKEFYIQVPPMVTEIFKATTSLVVGDGASTFFWLDNWLPDGRLKDLVPHLFALIPRRLSRSRLVKDCLDGGWLYDIPGMLLVFICRVYHRL
jgi:hypothetical protein